MNPNSKDADIQFTIYNTAHPTPSKRLPRLQTIKGVIASNYSLFSKGMIGLSIIALTACGGDIASDDGSSSDNSGGGGSGPISESPSMPPNVTRGRALYDSLSQGCLSCHGADGQADTFKPIDLNATTYQHSSVPGTSYSLEEYLELWMPVSDPSICIGSCAEDIAAYIRFLADPANVPPETPSLSANASASQNLQGFAPLTTTFNASQSLGTIASYEWDFGDGTSGSGVQQSHQYQTPGTYQAELTVIDNEGNADSTSITVVVLQEQVNTAPIAAINSSAVTGIAPLTVTLDGSGSSDDQGIASYQWTINGTLVNTVNTNYTFNDPGTYEVQLRVQDSEGLESTATQTITVASPTVNIAPVADASRSSNLSGPSPLTVNFDASASSDDRNQITGYYWNFENGQEVEGVMATRIFDTEGAHTVFLTVLDSEGLNHTVTLTVTVNNANQAPEADATALSATTGLAPYNLSFSSTNSSDDTGITQWAWDFNGDNITDSTTANPSFNYTQAGHYTVNLTVTDAQGLSDSDNLLVQILDPDTFAEARYAADCSSCHGANGEGGPGSPSLIRNWTTAQLQPDVLRMVNLHGNCQSINQADCVNALTAYMIEEFEPDDTPLPSDEAHLISVPVKALNETEFYNTVTAVFSINFTDTEKQNFNLPLDSSASRYSTDSTLRVLRGLSSDSSVLDDLYPALTEINNALLDDLTGTHFQTTYGATAGCSFSSIANSASCRSAYRSAILSKAFRRTVAGNDYAMASAASAYDIFVNDGLSAEQAFINAMVTYTLFSPEFLFHSYRGEEEGDGYQLTDEELAQKVAYLVWGAPADSTTLSLDWSELLSGNNDAQLDTELVRLFSDSRSNYFINTFLQQWLQLETDVAEELSSTSDSGRAEEFAEAIEGESEHFIRHLITQNEDINSVINADYTFMNDSLADYYGINVSGLGSSFSRVDFSGNSSLSNRQGLLTQANFLTTGTKSDRPGTVHRGVTILKDVACHIIGPPSGETPDISGVDRTQHTESALFRMVTETPGSSCIGCHQTINPVSFPFEAFDRFGRHPLTLSSSGSLPEYIVYEAIGVDSNPNANGPVEKADTFYLDVRGGTVNFSTDHGRTISGSFSDHQGLINIINQTPAFGECLNDNFYDFIIGTNAERGLTASNAGNATQHASQTASKQAALNGVSGIRTLIANLMKRPEFSVIRRD